MNLQPPASDVLALMRNLAEKDFPGSVSDEPTVFGTMHDFSGFCIHVDGSLALVELGTAGIPDWLWSVQVTSGLALEVPNTHALMEWVNERNRTATIGKYYCTIGGGNGLASVLYETMIFGGSFRALFDDNLSDDAMSVVGGRVSLEMRHVVKVGASQRAEVVNKFGGRFFDCSPAGLMYLFMVSAGDPPQ